MPFDEQPFATWLRESRHLRKAPDAYPRDLRWIQDTGHLSIDQYVPERTPDLLLLLDSPISGPFSAERPKQLQNAQTAVRRYDEFIRERDHLPKRRSMIIFGLWKDKMYLAPDAFSPEEYRTHNDQQTAA